MQARRLSYDIAAALTLPELAALALANRHKALKLVHPPYHPPSLQLLVQARRLSYNIAAALTLPELAALALANRHKASQDVWKDKHEAALLMRTVTLVYFKAVTGTTLIMSGV